MVRYKEREGVNKGWVGFREGERLKKVGLDTKKEKRLRRVGFDREDKKGWIIKIEFDTEENKCLTRLR